MGLREWFFGVDRPVTFAGELSASDPRVVALLGGAFSLDTGLPTVDEANALAIPAYSRGEEIIVSTLAGLPLKAYEKADDGSRSETISVLDAPQGPASLTAHEWRTTLYTHLVRYREAYLKPITTGDGIQTGIELVHPSSIIDVQAATWGKVFTVLMADRSQRTFTSDEIRQVLVPPFVGAMRGRPIYKYSEATFQLAIAALTARGRVLTAPVTPGLVKPAKDAVIPDTEVPTIMEGLNARIAGANKAGQFAYVNRDIELVPWTQTNLDAQFAETLDDVNSLMATLLGIPEFMLGQAEKQSSWGTGIAEQKTGISQFTLTGYSNAVESAFKFFLPPGQYAETDYKGLLAGTPGQEIELLLAQTGGQAILTPDEARTKLNLGPMPKSQEVATDGL